MLDRILDATESLMLIDSPTGNEQQVGDWLEQRLRALAPHELVRARNSLCVVPCAPRPGASTLMLLGHTDTVPKLGENPVRREGDKLHGLGASDMKAALAVMLELCAQAKGRAPRHDLVCVFYGGEEGSFDESEMPAIHEAARPWFERTTLAVCMEPTDGQIQLGCLGTAHAEVTFTGKRAHSARPWQGDNAIHKSAGLLARLAARKPIEHEIAGLKFFEVVSATMAEMKGARNVIPDRFVLNVNYRFAPGKDEPRVRRDLEELLRGEAELRLTDYSPAGKVCATNPLLTELRAAAGNPETTAKQAWTDVGRLSWMGLDAINWGPGATAQAHQAGEWVSIAEIEKCWRVLEAWLL